MKGSTAAVAPLEPAVVSCMSPMEACLMWPLGDTRDRPAGVKLTSGVRLSSGEYGPPAPAHHHTCVRAKKCLDTATAMARGKARQGMSMLRSQPDIAGHQRRQLRSAAPCRCTLQNAQQAYYGSRSEYTHTQT